MAAALLTAILLSLAGLVGATVLGHVGVGAAALSRHVTIGIFATLITLLSHSMMMFYLIGKTRAVRDASTEGGLSREFAARIAALRKPMFTLATVAMALTMTTAILGASVDTRVLPSPVHAVLAYASIAANLVTLRFEASALSSSARVVSEVNRLLNA